MKLITLSLFFISLTFHTHALNEINVKSYGAVGDGKADDTKAFQSAINAAPKFTKTVIYLPKGTYRIASYTVTKNYLENYCLLLHSNLEFRGDNGLSLIRLSDHIFDKNDSTANAHLFYGSGTGNVSFFDLIIDMNGSNNLVPPKVIKNYCAVFTKRGSNYHVEDVVIKNCAGRTMMNIMGKGKGLVIQNCKFINGGNYVGIRTANKNQDDFSFIYSEWDSTIVRKNMIQQQNVDIALQSYSGGIELHGINSVAQDNYIEGCWPAIYITSSQGILKNIIIENNNILNCVTGISFWVENPVNDISILNNRIQLTHSRSKKLNLCAGIIVPNGNAKEYNDNLANAAPISNLQIRGNIIEADSMGSLSAALVLHSLQHSNIENNTITGMNYGGVVLLGSKWGTKDLNVQNNIFNDFRQNNDPNAVAAYVVVTDTYSKNIKDAPGYKKIVFYQNRFLRSDRSVHSPPGTKSKGIFLGGFVALPSYMIGEIQFANNQFDDASEFIRTIKTD